VRKNSLCWILAVLLLAGCGGATSTTVPAGAVSVPTTVAVPTVTSTISPTATLSPEPTATIARATATITMVAPTQPPKLRGLTLTITKTSGAEFFIHATGFHPSEKLTVKMTTFDDGVCVSNEPDPSCFWDRQADGNGTYDRTTPLDVVTTKGKHWYWIEGAQSGATNRVAVDLAPVATSTSVSVTPTSVSPTMPSSVATLNLPPANTTPADTSSLSTSGGSTCADGTHSPSTGSGTCSHHGGIAGGVSSSSGGSSSGSGSHCYGSRCRHR